MDGLTSLLGGAINPLLGESSGRGVTPSQEWALQEILGTAYGYLLGSTIARIGPTPPAPVGDITLWVLHSGAGWINRTDWAIYPLKRTASVGSRGSLTLTISNAGKADGVTWRPQQFDDIRLYIGTYLFFSGFVDNTVEKAFQGNPQYYQQTVQCLTYDAAADKRIYRFFLPAASTPLPVGVLIPLPSIRGNDITCNLPLFGGPYFVGDHKWDTISILQVWQSIADEFDYEFYLDANYKLWFFDPTFGRANAPFSILDIAPGAPPAEPVWQNLEVTNGGSAYCNKAYVKNNQTLAGNATDPNPFLLSYVPSISDAGEIARVEEVEMVQSVKNQVQTGTMAQLATSGLVAFEIHQVSIETFQIGLEPGQLIYVNTTVPLLNDHVLIESVDSDLVGPMVFDVSPYIALSGPLRFAHKVKASNAQMHRRSSGWLVWQAIAAGIAPPVDRTSYSPSWDLATDIPGLSNPGMSTGTYGAPIPAIRDGILRQVSLTFRTAPVTTAVIMDVLQNGVSIFPTMPAPGITFPIGGTAAVVSFTFTANPVNVKGPSSATAGDADQFTAVCLQGDAAATNGQLALTIQG